MKRKLVKTTIIVWSEQSPIGRMTLEEIGRDADEGDSFCSKMTSEDVFDPEGDPDWVETEFFDDPEPVISEEE